MEYYRRIRYAEWTATGSKTDARGLGTVTVYYTNGSNDEFAGIARGDFFMWEQTGFNWRTPPEGIIARPPIVEQETAASQTEQDSMAMAEYQKAMDRRKRIFKAADEALRAQIGEAEYQRLYGNGPTALM